MTGFGNAIGSPQVTTRPSLSFRVEDAEYADALRRLGSRSRLITITEPGLSGGCCVSFVIKGSSEHVMLKSSSKPLLTFLILLLLKHWDAMLSLRVDQERPVDPEPSDRGRGRSDD